MSKPIDDFWKIRLEEVKSALEGNNFEVCIAPNKEEAKAKFLNEIFPGLGVKSVSYGGSMTFVESGIFDAVKNNPDIEFIDPWEKGTPPEESMERRRQALLVDLFITGTNAVTEAGQLINLDATGNRVAALTFGPKQVMLFIGRNKIVSDLEEAMFRVKNYVAPVNSMRLKRKTPCVKTSYCEECKSPERICNTWTITEKSSPKGRTKIMLINEDMGF
ncbi:MAG TPA: lactate utilization protein [Deltaproteobacteria bacterium]|nr:lactate utilization protein [Deltaproteobacteria bacterium]